MQRRAGGGLDVSFALVLAHDDVDFTEVVASRKDLRIPLLAVPSQSNPKLPPASTAACRHQPLYAGMRMMWLRPRGLEARRVQGLPVVEDLTKPVSMTANLSC